jgi:RES domain-containing protein
MKVWRICREHYAGTALSGQGARLAAGRWNSLGVPMVYTSSSLALAAVEVFVHVKAEDEPEDLVSVCVDVPVEDAVVEREKRRVLSQLTADWRYGDPRLTLSIGDAWIVSSTSVALPVPSVVIAGEWNVLLNPAHREAGRIRVLETQPFRVDPRMFKIR